MLDWRDVFLWCSLVAAVPCCAQTTPEVRGTSGCYELTVGEWSPPGPNAAYHRIPSHIRLDTARTALGRGWVLSPNIAFPFHGAFPGTPNWNLVGDTLRLVWSNGFQPTIVKLTRADSSWIGEAIAETDAHPIPEPPLPRAHITARRRLCPDTLR